MCLCLCLCHFLCLCLFLCLCHFLCLCLCRCTVSVSRLNGHLGFGLCRPSRLVLSQSLRRRSSGHRGCWFRFLLEIHLRPSWDVVGAHNGLTLRLHIEASSGSNALTIFQHIQPYCIFKVALTELALIVDVHSDWPVKSIRGGEFHICSVAAFFF